MKVLYENICEIAKTAAVFEYISYKVQASCTIQLIEYMHIKDTCIYIF